MRVAGKLHWVHSASTGACSLFVAHERRGVVAMNAMGVLPDFAGVAQHDAWARMTPTTANTRCAVLTCCVSCRPSSTPAARVTAGRTRTARPAAHGSPTPSTAARPATLIDHMRIGVDHLPAPRPPRRRRRRRSRPIILEVLLHGPPVQAGLPGDLRDRCTRIPQHPEPAQLKPPLSLQHHPDQPPARRRSPTAEDSKIARPSRRRTRRSPLHVYLYLALHW